MDEPGRHRLDNAHDLRVLAHPLRLRILQVLHERGSATATEISEQVGESPANCSWHLRQLARHGFVEETGERKGRQRPWRPTRPSLEWGGSGESGETAAASDALSAVFMEEEFDGLRSWQAWRRTDPSDWQDAAALVQGSTWLTVEELAAVKEELSRVLLRYAGRAVDPAARPADARRVRMFAWAVPAEPSAEGRDHGDA